MPKRARQLFLAAGVALLAIGFAVGGMVWASRQVPDFYEENLVVAPLGTEGADFEEQALALHNQLQHTGHWEARFTEEQINAWLASDLPEKFPTLLPPSITEPRIALEADAVRLAARYHRGNLETVISLTGDVYLTDQPNEVAVRISQARAGYLPLPLGQFLEEIRERAQRADVTLRWTEVAGDPVALIRVPSERRVETCDQCEPERLVLQEVALKTGEFVVAGHIEQAEPARETAAAADAALQAGESDTHQR